MEFNSKVQKKFKEAGWNQDRNVLDVYSDVYKFTEYPSFLTDFLKEYGNLEVNETSPKNIEWPNKLLIIPHYAGYESDEIYSGDLKLFGKVLFPFAFYEKDGYVIACDADENIYMLGDYNFLIADNLKKGIEVLLEDDWKNGYMQMDESGKWEKK